MEEEIKISVFDKNFWNLKTAIKLSDMEKSRTELLRFEEAVNRSLRIINRRACANTNAINNMANEVNTNIGIIQAQLNSLPGSNTHTPRTPALFSTPRENRESSSDSSKSGNVETETICTLTGGIGQLEVFGDESVIAFDQWSERFNDYVGAMGRAWTEDEKIARLKMSLIGTPRQLFKQLTQTETAKLDTAINALRRKMDSPQRRELTKRTLAQCKQRENETISEFIKRLTPLVEIVNSSLSDVQRKEKICEEFLDRVRPNIGFLIRLVGLNSTKDLDQVKAQAEELEALLASERGTVSESLRDTVMALNNERQRSDNQTPNQSPPQWSNFSGSNSTPLGNQRPFRGFSRGRSRGGYKKSGFRNRSQHDNQWSNDQQMQSQRRWSNRPICHFCGRTGHIATFCRDRQAEMVNNSDHFGHNSQNDRSRRRGRHFRNNSPEHARNVTILDSDALIRAIANLSVHEPRPSGNTVTNESSGNLRTLSIIESPPICDKKSEEKIIEPIPVKNEDNAPTTSNWEGISPRISKLSKYMMILTIIMTMVMSSMAEINSVIPIPKGPMMCQTQLVGHLWALPSLPSCPLHKFDNIKTAVRKSILTLYKPNAFEYTVDVWACRKVRKNAQKFTTLGSVPVLEKLDPDHLEVNDDECRQMIFQKKCEFGYLVQEGQIFQTVNKIDLTPRIWLLGSFKWSKVSSENCYLFRTKIVVRFGNDRIESSLGVSDHCPFNDGSCKLNDLTLILWNPRIPRNCAYIKLQTYEGLMMGRTWVANEDPLLLTFDSNPKTVTSCGKNLTMSQQGYAIDHYKDTASRTKRAMESIVADSQLQSELSYLSFQVTQSMRFSFSHAMRSLCEHIAEIKRWVMSSAASDPSSLARILFNTSLLHAKSVGPGILKVWPCVGINRKDFEFVPLGENRHDKKECFADVPIKFRHGDVTHFAFLDTQTMEIKAQSKKRACQESRLQIVRFENEFFEINQLTGQLKSAKVEQYEAIEINPLTVPTITFHAFHHLFLNNVSDFYNHFLISDLLKMSEISYKIHNKDGEILITPSEQWHTLKNEVMKHVIGDWIPIWRSMITTLVGILIFELCARIYFMFKREYSIGRTEIYRSRPTKSHEITIPKIEYTPIRKIPLKRTGSLPCPCTVCAIKTNTSAVIPAKINELSVNCLADTGASVTIAPKSLAIRLGSEVLPANSVALSASGHKITFREKIKAELNLAGFERTITIYLVEDGEFHTANEYQILIGCDTFSKLPKISFDFIERRFYVADKWVTMGPDYGLAENIRVAASQNFTLPANSQQIIEGKIESFLPTRKNVLIEKPDQNLLIRNVGLISSVHAPLGETVKIPLINPTNEPIFFIKGMHLAYANELEENEGILSEAPD